MSDMAMNQLWASQQAKIEDKDAEIERLRCNEAKMLALLEEIRISETAYAEHAEELLKEIQQAREAAKHE